MIVYAPLAPSEPAGSTFTRNCVPAGADAVHVAGEHLGVAMPLQFRTRLGVLNFISTTTIFGTPVDVTLQELALETFFPADAPTGEALRRLAREIADGGA